MPTLTPGQLFVERYRIVDVVVQGPLSELYRAYDEERGCEVALKLPGTSSSVDGEVMLRLCREAEVGLAVNHQNVVRTIGRGETRDGRPYVVTEWLDGESLLELLERDGALPTLLALSLGREAAAGLAALHAEGMVHCDVKPENLFLCGPKGRPTCLKLLDFGLVRATGQSPSDSGQVIAGTLQYIAPEQAANETLDCRADIYALGVVLFRLLTGELPFDTRSPVGLLRHHLFSVPPPPSWLRDHGLAGELDLIALTAMRKNRENRYGSMGEIIDDIDRFVSGERVEGRKVVVEDRFVPSSEGGRRAVGIIAKTARMVDSPLSVASVEGPDSEAPPPDACSAA